MGLGKRVGGGSRDAKNEENLEVAGMLEHEQQGVERAAYGEELIARLSADPDLWQD